MGSKPTDSIAYQNGNCKISSEYEKRKVASYHCTFAYP